MALTIAHGHPGLEVPHIWNGGLTMNVRSARPWIKLNKITGGHSLSEIEDDRDNNTGRRGETPRPAYARGKTVVYEGVLLSKTLDAMRLTATQMRGAFRDRNNEGTMLLNGELDWFFRGRVMSFDMDDEQFTGWGSIFPFQRAFTLALRMSDGRYYYTVPHDDSAAGWASASVHLLTNEGIADTDPIFKVAIPGADATVTLENLSMPTSNGTARLRFTHLPAGLFTVDFNTRFADVGGVDVSGKWDVAYSQWWDEEIEGMHPGDNNLKVTGGAWGVSFYHASE